MSEDQTTVVELISTAIVIATAGVLAAVVLIAFGAWFKRRNTFQITDHFNLAHRDEPTEPINNQGRVRRHNIVYRRVRHQEVTSGSTRE